MLDEKYQSELSSKGVSILDNFIKQERQRIGDLENEMLLYERRHQSLKAWVIKPFGDRSKEIFRSKGWTLKNDSSNWPVYQEWQSGPETQALTVGELYELYQHEGINHYRQAIVQEMGRKIDDPETTVQIREYYEGIRRCVLSGKPSFRITEGDAQREIPLQLHFCLVRKEALQKCTRFVTVREDGIPTTYCYNNLRQLAQPMGVDAQDLQRLFKVNTVSYALKPGKTISIEQALVGTTEISDDAKIGTATRSGG